MTTSHPDNTSRIQVYVIAKTTPTGAFDTVASRARPDQNQGSPIARLIEAAGRTCYDSFGTGRDSTTYHKHLLESKHGSVLEHASLTFYIAGVSRACTHELVRHRAGCAISQRSTRYVDESESNTAWHPLLERVFAHEKADFASQIIEHSAINRRLYKIIVDRVIRYLVIHGVPAAIATKQARGAARGILETCLATELIWTANIRALRHVIEQRASRFADAEIRILANKLYEAAVTECPEYFSDYEKRPTPDGIGYELVTRYSKV